jgi:hypothetical protein
MLHPSRKQDILGDATSPNAEPSVVTAGAMGNYYAGPRRRVKGYVARQIQTAQFGLVRLDRRSARNGLFKTTVQ